MVAAALWLSAGPTTRLVTDLLPRAATAGGAGTRFPNLEEALPQTLRLLALAAAAIGLLHPLLLPSVPHLASGTWSRRGHLMAHLLVGVAAFSVFLWYAAPGNLYPTNARIHWVDIYFDRRDDLFYVLVKLHRLVYDVPHLFQAAVGSFNTLLVLRVARSIWPNGALPLLVASSFLGSTLVLLFADVAEDVHLSLAPVLVVLLAHLTRRPLLFGAAAFAAVLARPQLALVGASIIAVEALALLAWPAEGTGRWATLRRDRFLVQGAVTFAVLLVAWFALMTLIDANWILEGSESTSALSATEPREIDGFTIHPFSGSYVLHLVWIGGPLVIAGNLLCLVGLRDLPERLRTPLAAGWLYVGASLLLLEARPLLYFNVRYLAYLWPHLLIGAWCCLLHPAVARRPRLLLLGALALLTVPATTYRADLDLREGVLRNPYTELFGHRRDLRRLAAGEPITVVTASPTTVNLIAYLVRRPIEDIAVVETYPRDGDGIVFAPAHLAEDADDDIVLRTEDLVVARP